MKLAGLIDGMSKALQVPLPRVRTAAAQLRKHGLLTSGPRGPGAPDMTPSDATNLLLAIMYDGELAVAERSVLRMREAPFLSCLHRKFDEAEVRRDDYPRNGIFSSTDGRPNQLGEVLETILDWFVRYGSLEEGDDYDLDLSIVNLTVTISSPGYAGTIHFNTHEGFWDLHYEWKPPEQLAYEVANKGNRLATRWDALAGPHVWSSRTAPEECLNAIADCLRGHRWYDAKEEIRAPYDDQVLADPEPALAQEQV